MFRFATPWAFLLLAVIPALLYVRFARRRPPAVRFPATGPLKRLPRTWRVRLAALPVWIRAAALALLVIALARPQEGSERVVDVSRGVAIEMVVDRSSSMGAELRYRGRRLNRLEAALRLFRDFVEGSGDLAGRPSDLIGLVTFARYADTICPLTLDHDTLIGFLPTVRLVDRESEDGTAIGDAVALAAARLRTAEEALAGQTGRRKDYEIKSKVIILLTDGQNNAGKRTVEEAAELAASWGIKIYAIGIGGEGAATIRTPFGTYTVPVGEGVDEATLRTLAETTGGMYRVAEDAEALRAVYEEIDKLEKTEIESTRFVDYREMFPPFAVAGLLLLGLETVLGAVTLRRAP